MDSLYFFRCICMGLLIYYSIAFCIIPIRIHITALHHSSRLSDYFKDLPVNTSVVYCNFRDLGDFEYQNFSFLTYGKNRYNSIPLRSFSNLDYLTCSSEYSIHTEQDIFGELVSTSSVVSYSLVFKQYILTILTGILNIIYIYGFYNFFSSFNYRPVGSSNKRSTVQNI